MAKTRLHYAAFLVALTIGTCGAGLTNSGMPKISQKKFEKMFFSAAIPKDASQEATFVQIGAHVGFEANDPLWPPLRKVLLWETAQARKWKWLLVEPVPANIRELKRNLAANKVTQGGEIIVENAAIATNEMMASGQQHLTFYAVSGDIDPITGKDKRSGKFLPAYISQIGSFDREQILKEKRSWRKVNLDVEKYIDEIQVEVLNIKDLLGRHNISGPNVSVLMIDTEGYDCPILKGIDLTLIRPAVLIYEYKHCSLEDLRKVHDIVSAHYEINMLDAENDVCWLKK